MKITIVCVGKVKERYLRDGIAEYAKRLGRYCTLSWYEVADEKTPENAPAGVERKIKEIEGERLLKGIPEHAYVIALCIEGETPDSVELSEKLSGLMSSGKSQLVFVIGGSLGLSDAVIGRADYRLSFSRMTFPHQLMRMILLEQIYRSFRIIHHEPYHK